MSGSTELMNSSYLRDGRKLLSARMNLLHGCVPAERWMKPSPEQQARMREINKEYDRLDNQLARLHNLPLPHPEEPEE